MALLDPTRHMRACCARRQRCLQIWEAPFVVPELPPPPQPHTNQAVEPLCAGGRAAGNPSQTHPTAGMLTRMIFRIGIQFTWGLGLIAAALVLGKKADDPLPWAIGILGAIVVAGTLLAAMAEQNNSLTSTTTDRKPGATGTQ